MLLAVLLALALPLIALPARAGAEEPATCTGRTMSFVAHEDDDLLFLSPSLLRELESGRCMRTVFLTAGDDGKSQAYWSMREEGVEAAYAEMAGVADSWTTGTLTVAGHTLALRTLTAEPRLSVVFMRLPDGGFPSGTGTPLYGNQSLMKLWNSAHPCSGCETESTITADDNSASYTYPELVASLAALMTGYGPRQVFTQNYTIGFSAGDHPDHVASALFTQAAAAQYTGAHRLSAFVGYNTESMVANLSGTTLARKSAAFYAYGAHDAETCTSQAACAGTEYEVWLAREYVAARETTGVVAHAGYIQEVTTGATVSLDGSRSSDQSGAPLAYQWTQVGGPAVTLTNADKAKPTFTMISHPTVLTFALTVSAGGTTSSPDYVRIRVPTADPTPVAEAGDPQTVASEATVHLDGGESWDPNSLPLEYRWTQTGSGPRVTLVGGETAAPSFVAPRGPTEVAFSLVVSNGTQTSAPAAVAVQVLGVAPSVTSATSTGFTAGTFGSFQVSAAGGPAPVLTVEGELPPGVTFTGQGDGTATLAGTAASSVASPGGTRAYPLVIKAENGLGTATQAFTLTVTVLPESTPTPAPTPQPQPPTVDTTTPPAFSSPAVVYGYVGRKLSVPVTAVGTPAPAIFLSGSAPAGLTFRADAPGVAHVSGAPRATGSFRLALAAANVAGSAQQRLRLVVDPAPKLSRSGLTVAPGASARRAVRVAGHQVRAVRCAGRVPAGMRCVVRGAGGVVLTGTPSPAAAGAYKLRVTVKGRAGTVERPLTVRVG